jgi:N6-adenosine-specific RNA methylase IME4
MSWEGLSPPYRTIVADPPWRPNGWDRSRYESPKAGPSKRYSTMALKDICEMAVGNLAHKDAHLWLWAINGMMEDAYQVVRAWGFTARNVVTWCKPGPGVGAYFRNNTEHAIFATRGRPQPPDVVPLSTWYEWPRSRHSVKPAAFYDLVERVSPAPYLDLFTRQQRFGWDSWGWGFEQAEVSQ